MKTSVLFLVLFLASAVSGQMATVIAEKANLRGTPSDKGKIVDKLQRGDAVEVVIDSGSGWYLVQAKDYAGWLHGNSIRIDKESLLDLMPVLPKPSRNVMQDLLPAPPARTYIRSPRGGCYYLNSKGNKTYVDRSLCG